MVAVRLLFDELVGAGDVGRLPPLFLTAVLISKAQVGGHVSGKEYILLGDIADQIPQLVQFILFYIHIVHIDMAYRGVVKPRDQLEDAGLAATGAPDNGGDLPGPALEANILQHWFVRPRIGKGHMVKGHTGAAFAQGGTVSAVLDGTLGIQHFCDALSAGIGHRKEHNDQCQHHDSGKDHADILAVGHQVTHCHLPGGHIPGTHAHDRCCSHTKDHLNHRHQQCGHPPRENGHGGQFSIGLGKPFHFFPLPIESPNHPYPLQCFQKDLVQSVNPLPQGHRVAGNKNQNDTYANDEGGNGQAQHGTEFAAGQRREYQPSHRHQRCSHPQPQQQ